MSCEYVLSTRYGMFLAHSHSDMAVRTLRPDFSVKKGTFQCPKEIGKMNAET